MIRARDQHAQLVEERLAGHRSQPDHDDLRGRDESVRTAPWILSFSNARHVHRRVADRMHQFSVVVGIVDPAVQEPVRQLLRPRSREAPPSISAG